MATTMRICFFGDSFVNGYGDPLMQGWVGRVCALARARGADITSYNCGVRRATSEDVRASWLSEAVARLPPEHPGAVVFSFGANDQVVENGKPRVSYQRQMENARAILTAAAARWSVLFISSPGAGEQEDAVTRVDGLRAICNELAIPFLDGFAASAHFKAWPVEAAAGDGAHPGAGGYAELAAIVDAWLAWRGLC